MVVDDDDDVEPVLFDDVLLFSLLSRLLLVVVVEAVAVADVLAVEERDRRLELPRPLLPRLDDEELEPNPSFIHESSESRCGLLCDDSC